MEIAVTGKGERGSETTGADLSPLGCLGITAGELQVPALAVVLQLTATSLGLSMLKAGKVPPLESGAASLESRSGLEGAAGAGVEAV